MQLLFKVVWAAKNIIYDFFLRFCFFITQGSFFKRIGKGIRFFGCPTFGSVEGNITIGDYCWIGKDVFFSCSKGSKIKIGHNCSFNTGCHIVSGYGITIGDNTRIGEYVSIRDQNHHFSNREIPVKNQGYYGKPITIGEDVWIGRGVFIGAGVVLEKGCVVGANSVVTKSFKPYSIIAGIPARLIRERGMRKEKERL